MEIDNSKPSLPSFAAPPRLEASDARSSVPFAARFPHSSPSGQCVLPNIPRQHVASNEPFRPAVPTASRQHVASNEPRRTLSSATESRHRGMPAPEPRSHDLAACMPHRPGLSTDYGSSDFRPELPPKAPPSSTRQQDLQPSRPPKASFAEAENVCRAIYEESVRKYGPAWHLCTPGENQQLIFDCKEDFEFGMTALAMTALECKGVKIVTFELMGNHLHIVLFGRREDCKAFFDSFKKKLRRYLASKKSGVSLSTFNAGLYPIDSLESLRTHIAYTNRNNYLVDPMQTPWSYPYGANGFYFSKVHKQNHRCRFGDLTITSRREMTHTHDCTYPPDLFIIDNYISPVSFCDIALGESMFRDARHYFYKVSRDIEGYGEAAKAMGDKIYYTYDELMAAVYRICKKSYNGQKPNLLNQREKTELAKSLHYDYKSSNKTISRILNIDLSIVNAWFPAVN